MSLIHQQKKGCGKFPFCNNVESEDETRRDETWCRVRVKKRQWQIGDDSWIIFITRSDSASFIIVFISHSKFKVKIPFEQFSSTGWRSPWQRRLWKCCCSMQKLVSMKALCMHCSRQLFSRTKKLIFCLLNKGKFGRKIENLIAFFRIFAKLLRTIASRDSICLIDNLRTLMAFQWSTWRARDSNSIISSWLVGVCHIECQARS